jgi:hypothetical protein
MLPKLILWNLPKIVMTTSVPEMWLQHATHHPDGQEADQVVNKGQYD